MTDKLPDWVFEERKAIARDAISRFFEGSIGLLKWVLTSTAVFHSAALIAGFNSTQFAPIMFAGPAWAFLGGIGLTLGSGIVLAIGAADYAGKLTNSLWKGQGLDTCENDTYDPEPSGAIVVGAVLLGLSIAAFMVGIGFAAYEIGQLPVDQTQIEKKA
ncbi:hypothetical protein U4960_11720 [Altererythrobacter sp. H2]|uniref:hypothetical protein n=1 Tax=Altererythrobacter sp. H2 TaxID=3108391 RepID=UPI002B4C085C|nr:hypothetical protein [Altererythrobacter sp. H2]WRK94958.1 hypothetical protein U4960_11720 [Altererythrobacter sp. H2]